MDGNQENGCDSENGVVGERGGKGESFGIQPAIDDIPTKADQSLHGRLPFLGQANFFFSPKFQAERSSGEDVEPPKENQSMASESGPRPGGKKPRTPEEISSEIDDLQSQVQNLASTVSDAAGQQLRTAQASLQTTIRDNPLASVAIAAAAGFLYAMIRR
jgi:ElaB/YqjD/DUF883 family membrane-anchored ribosome-binding protein